MSIGTIRLPMSLELRSERQEVTGSGEGYASSTVSPINCMGSLYGGIFGVPAVPRLLITYNR